MEKIKKLIPDKISVAGHQVVVSEKQFTLIVDTLDLLTNTLNSVIESINEIDKHLDDSDKLTKKLQDSIQILAKALQTYTED